MKITKFMMKLQENYDDSTWRKVLEGFGNRPRRLYPL